jgi:hypothetical protein
MAETEFSRAQRYWIETCQLTKKVDSIQSEVTRLKALLERAKEWVKANHEMPGYSELLSDLERGPNE